MQNPLPENKPSAAPYILEFASIPELEGKHVFFVKKLAEERETNIVFVTGMRGVGKTMRTLAEWERNDIRYGDYSSWEEYQKALKAYMWSRNPGVKP